MGKRLSHGPFCERRTLFCLRGGRAISDTNLVVRGARDRLQAVDGGVSTRYLAASDSQGNGLTNIRSI